ncbi:uncharacterized protein LOC126355393 [Schistocerca gregaria]|uniref:uncharacterized protein LOC126355393 n=1 Tax=Schistocerca gregaria TaxID=7010 RepID=UPI00211DEF0D|nr:uncharacterized protein LOC126355393 [Schistocerca gregaria]
MKKNKRDIPLEFATSKGSVVHNSLFGFKKGCTLVSYIPKKGKCVILASSLNEDNSVDAGTGDKQKPSIVTFYNSTKGGVDTTDKLTTSYNVARDVCHWPMVIFSAMINMSGINSQVIYYGNNENFIQRKGFVKQLSNALVLPHLVRRSLDTSGIHRDLQLWLQQYRPTCETEAEDTSRNEEQGTGSKS